jgi:hypothetical protein
MSYQNDQPPEGYEPTPVIGPGICEEVAQRMLGNTLVTDIDPLSIFPQETDEDLEKLEARVEGWYNLLSQLGELKAQLSFRVDPYNRVGLLYTRIEQYMLLLASPNCTPELKAQYWADVVAAQNSQNEVVPTITITLTQAEFGRDQFTVTVGEVAKDPAYSTDGDWQFVLKRATNFYRVRRWVCSSWKVIFTEGDPIQMDSPEALPGAVAARLDDQENEIILRNSYGL